MSADSLALPVQVGSALQKQLSRRSADSVRPADIESITHDLPRIDTHTPDPLRVCGPPTQPAQQLWAPTDPGSWVHPL